MNCGEATAAEIDAEVMEMLKAAYEEAKRLLRENREALDKISEFLIEKETITGKEFMRIYREIKGLPQEEETKEGETAAKGADAKTMEASAGNGAAQEAAQDNGAGDSSAAGQPDGAAKQEPFGFELGRVFEAAGAAEDSFLAGTMSDCDQQQPQRRGTSGDFRKYRGAGQGAGG